MSSYYQSKFEGTNRAELSQTTSRGDRNGSETAAKIAREASTPSNDKVQAIQYLDKAIELSVEAVNACRDDDWDLARLLRHLGDRLLQRVPITQSIDDIEGCLRAYDLALKADLAAPRYRISAARSADPFSNSSGYILYTNSLR